MTQSGRQFFFAKPFAQWHWGLNLKFADRKNIVELVGIAAIVGSLIFVGLQLQQADKIARNEASYAVADRHIEIRNTIIENAEVWEKGNSGSELSASDRVIYSNLIQNFNTQYIWSWRASRRMGGAGEFHIAELGGFLFDNPPALEVWESLQSDLDRYQTPLVSGPRPTEFSQLVREGIKTLERTYKQNSLQH